MRVPILQIRDVLVTSIQIDLTDEDAMAFQRDLVTTIEEGESLGVVIDIMAMEVIDSFLARMINETANMARLLGAQVVVTGMQPDVALTLIEMGRQLVGVETALNLEQGLNRLREMADERVGVEDAGKEVAHVG